MAASPIAENGGPAQPQDKWAHADDHAMGPRGDADASIGLPPPADTSRGPGNSDYPRGSSVDVSVSGSKADTAYRDKQVKPNKVYVGGLPEHTRVEDLQSCFGKIGHIVNIELKLGYGFVEFDTREAAEESVAKYHEGYFMGNKIRVEISRGGGKTAKYGDPGACFKCGQLGHWARECPINPGGGGGSYRRSQHHGSSEASLIDRIQPPSRHYPPPPPRDFPPYRDDSGPGRYPPPRDPRYDYPPPPPIRELRRPPTPPREYRDYPPAPPPARSRDYDRDYRIRVPPPSRYDAHAGYFPPDNDGSPGYAPRGYGPPPAAPPRDVYDRYERRPPPATDRYASYQPPSSARPRTPPAGPPPPRARDDYERSHPARDYPPPEYRGRPVSPTASRYVSDYPPRAASPDIPPHRYRRRSASPPPRSSGNAHYDSGYQGNGPAGGFPSSGYGGSVPGGPPHQASRSSGNSRDYPRNGRDEPSVGYRRQ